MTRDARAITTFALLCLAVAMAACTGSASTSPIASAPPTVSASVPATGSALPPSAAPSPSALGETLSGTYPVGGNDVFIECHGTGSPTVVIEAGLNQDSTPWSGVVRDLAATSRTCRYDRAGIGRSQVRNSGAEVSVGDRAVDLHDLLATAGVEGPYVLLGFSYGGMLIRAFADRFPAETAGLVFVDGSHEEQFAPGGWWLEQQPEWADGATTVDLARSRAELLTATDLGDRPVIVLTNGLMTGEGERRWSVLQDAIAAMSTNGLHMVATEAGHDIRADRPELVTESARAVLAAARDGSALPACGPRFQALGAECLGGTLADLLAEWDGVRNAITPAAGDLPAGTYTFTEDGTVVTLLIANGHLDVKLRQPDGLLEAFTADYAEAGGEVVFRWPFDWRIPRTPGVNRASWTADPDGTLHFVQLDDAASESWLAVPWAPVVGG